ncbi:hypothetical protein D3C85_1456930 [compost metagenome]
MRRAERASRLAQQGLGPNEVPQLRHGDAAQGQGGRVIAQRNVVQRGQRIARRQGASGACDQQIHGCLATFNPSPCQLRLNLPLPVAQMRGCPRPDDDAIRDAGRDADLHATRHATHDAAPFTSRRVPARP